MKKYFIETSAVIDYLRGKSETIKLINELGGELTSSYICLAELYEGIARTNKKEKAEKGVLDFFSGLSEVYGLDEEIAKTFGRIRADLKKEGKVIEDLDIIIASTCLVYDLVLVTYNPKHFRRIKNLKILDLQIPSLRY